MKAIDIGSFYTDSSKIRAALGWEPRVPLREGLARTIQYYRQYLPRYLDAPAGSPIETA
jgi:UDP-glucose 4-epimerase